MVTTVEVMSLERFNKLWARRSIASRESKYAPFLRELRPLTPTRVPVLLKHPVNAVRKAFHVMEKRGEITGTLKIINLGDEGVWACLFPSS